MKERNVAAPLLCSQRHLAAAGPKALWKAPRMVFCLCATNSSPSPAAGCMLCVIVRVDWVQEASLCCFLRRRVGKCPEYSLSVISIVSGWSKENIWVALSLTSDITPYVDQLYILIWGPREGIKPHTHTHTPRTLSLGVTLQLFSDKYLAQLWVISLPHQVLSLLKQLDSETEGHQWVVVSGPFLNFCPFGKERWFLLVSVRAISGQLWRQEKTEMEMVRGGIRQIARYLLTAT